MKSQILDRLEITNPDVLVKPGIGEDCSALAFGENACVLTTDPITGAVNDVGRLAVHVSCNDVASCGVKTIGLLITILAPVDSTIEDLSKIMDQINETCREIDVSVLGGHTEVTSAVTRFVVVTTAVGKCLASSLVKTSGAKAGDTLIMTKSAALEGTAIIASDKFEELKNVFPKDFLETAKAFVKEISVIDEGVLAGTLGAHSMHDVTEGGVLGAAWEMAEASGLGITVYKNNIPVRIETRELCKHYEMDPFRLISSGSMLIACNNELEMIEALTNIGVQATSIGRFTLEQNMILVGEDGTTELLPSASDEIYKL